MLSSNDHTLIQAKTHTYFMQQFHHHFQMQQLPSALPLCVLCPVCVSVIEVGSLGEGDLPQMVDHDLLPESLVLRRAVGLSEAERLPGEFGHVVHQFLAVEGAADEPDSGVLGDGVVKGVCGSFEDAAVVGDVGRSGLDGDPLDLIEGAGCEGRYSARRYCR
jgi:hypothetical protein